MSTNPAPINVRLRGTDTDGRLAVVENVISAGFGGPPLHVHPSFDETFYVLEGELTFRLRDEIVSLPAGSLVFAAGSVPHTFANRSGQEARVLILCTPAGFERYFDRLAAEQVGEEPPPEALGPLPEVQVVGPPIGARLQRITPVDALDFQRYSGIGRADGRRGDCENRAFLVDGRRHHGGDAG
jgi:quercetin dioxygenase-like cupin family protein